MSVFQISQKLNNKNQTSHQSHKCYTCFSPHRGSNTPAITSRPVSHIVLGKLTEILTNVQIITVLFQRQIVSEQSMIWLNKFQCPSWMLGNYSNCPPSSKLCICFGLNTVFLLIYQIKVSEIKTHTVYLKLSHYNTAVLYIEESWRSQWFLSLP